MFNQHQLDAIDHLIHINLIESGLDHVLFIDLAGNAAVDAMAKLVGETEFSLLFHKGEKASIHFSKVTGDTILITMFNKEISLGLVRLKVAETIDGIKKTLAENQ